MFIGKYYCNNKASAQLKQAYENRNLIYIETILIPHTSTPKVNKNYNTWQVWKEHQTKTKEVDALNISLTRSLNGQPKTHEEMKAYTFRSEAVANAIHTVNKRINPTH